MMLFDIREGAKKKTKWTVKVVLEGLATGLGPCVCGWSATSLLCWDMRAGGWDLRGPGALPVVPLPELPGA